MELQQKFESPDHVLRRTFLVKTLQKLSEFSAFKSGWDLGRGEELDMQALIRALRLLEIAFEAGLWRSNAFPSSCGDVMITFTQGVHDVEVLARSDGTYRFVYEQDDEGIFDYSDLSDEQTKALLEETARMICMLEPSMQPSTTTTTKVDFGAQLLSPRVTAESRYSPVTVPSKGAVTSARTYTHFIQTPVAYPQFFGLLTQQTRLQEAA